MGKSSFENQYLNDFVLSDEDKLLQALAKNYHDETESYDLLICSAKNERGVAVPTSNWEFSQINKNAIEVMKRLMAHNPSVNRAKLNKAISKYPY